MLKDFDYKIPEEWFYTLYYYALAILSKFGVESISQRYNNYSFLIRRKL